ncbi:MAG: hypothetical protein NT010_14075 [Proteobacteria bacterium]|nr:hypothetical protein [Pseudomonadota bacterium]
MRDIAFLVSEDEWITAKANFDGLGENAERTLRTRFDYWLECRKPNKKWYHGWSQSEFGGKYTHCFVFKCEEKKKAHRFYGFLCNPKASNRRYQACILVSHVYKKEWKTDPTNLQRVDEISRKPPVERAISDYFKERP